MSFNKYKLRSLDYWLYIKPILIKHTNRTLFTLSFILFVAAIYDLGFLKDDSLLRPFLSAGLFIYAIILLLTMVMTFNKKNKLSVFIIETIVLLTLFLFFLYTSNENNWFVVNLPFFNFLNNYFSLFLIISIIFLIELSKNSLHVYKMNFNPALLFVFSFFVFILFGSGLLMLPNATYHGISFVDSLFTSASAVCVTGLSVIDTGSSFTYLGKVVLVMLIQIGGLGIMTFTSLFGFFFKGGSFQNHVFLKDMVNAERIGEVFKTIIKICIFTFFIELAGAFLIYIYFPANLNYSILDKVEFSIFHSISAFCNAGFSTLSNSFYDINFRFNYNIHLVISFLIIFGGIGFPIMINFYHYIKTNIKNGIKHILRVKNYEYIPRVINVHTKIVLVTTICLLIFGWLAYFVLEYNNTLSEHGLWGKMVVAFFNSVTPRTAGFNNVNMAEVLQPTLLIIIFLMWVGASPASTGGGIKTTTFAVAMLNVFSLARGKDRVEVFKREVTNDSIRRAFAVILLSALVLGVGVFLVSTAEPDKGILAITFECFSAFGTVGLSVGITPNLTDFSKLVLTFLMFCGRVGALTIVISMLKQIKYLHYHYPSEGIYIN